ncbi:DJ-1/PfpI family protein, partial [bacterium]|nr:DJ-1/PfpI family protein [bacterium]
DYDAVLFIGGGGSRQYFDDIDAHWIARQAVGEEKILGGICSAVSILANAGVLKGKRATAFSSEGPNLRAKGANYTGAAVEIDGKIITANGPQSATKFGQAILEALAE